MAALVVAPLAGAQETPPADWRDPACEEDGGRWAGTDYCRPDRTPEQPPPAPESHRCRGAVACEATPGELDRAGFSSRDVVKHAPRLRRRFGSVNGRAEGGYLNFHLYLADAAQARCSETVEDSNHCGWLFHTFVREERDGLRTSTTGFPARSGDNDPGNTGTPNKGPIPEVANGYLWGFMHGRFTGFEASADASFDPGKWRLDPWEVGNRSSFEIHGGSGSHEFSRSRTKGCIRLQQASVDGLRYRWDHTTPNRDAGAPVIVEY